MKPFSIALLLAASACAARAIIPVTDYAALINNQIAHAETMAKWVDSIAHLKTQIDQMKRQISITEDLRTWSGNPLNAGASVVLDGFSESELVRDFGRTKAELVNIRDSLASLKDEGHGVYSAITGRDLDGGETAFSETVFRRYAVLDARKENADEVAAQTKERSHELQKNVAETLVALKAASTDAEVQKLSAKLAALNAQLGQVEAERKRQVDEVALQKISNDSRLEEERMAAAELEAKDAYLTQQRVSAYMKTLRLREASP